MEYTFTLKYQLADEDRDADALVERLNIHRVMQTSRSARSFGFLNKILNSRTRRPEQRIGKNSA